MSQTPSPERNRAIAPADGLLALLAGLVAGIVYALGAAPGVLFGDGGELQFAAWTAGLPHPTGYPLYMLIGWAWSYALEGLGLASPSRAMNLLSATFGGVAVAMTYLLARALVAQAVRRAGIVVARLAALLAALTFAFTPTVWSQAVAAEVYTLHAAFVALILWLALLWKARIDSPASANQQISKSANREIGASTSLDRQNDGSTRGWPGAVLAALALAVGLGLAHHRTTLLLLPVLLVFLWAGAGSRYWRSQWRQLVVMALLAAAPLLLYLYVPLRVDHTPYLAIELRPGQPVDLMDRSPAGLVAYLLGRGFAGELQSVPAALAAAPSLLARLAAELTPLGLLLAAAGVIVLAAHRRWSLLWLTGGSFAALVAFNLFYTIGDIAVFYIPPYLIACAWIAAAAGWLVSLIAPALPAEQARSKEEAKEQPSVVHRRSLQGHRFRLLQGRRAVGRLGTIPEGPPGTIETPSLGRPPGRRTGPFVVPLFVAPTFVVLFVVLLFVVLFLLPAYLFATHAATFDRSRDTRAGDWWSTLLAAGPPQDAVLVSNDRDEMMPLWYLQQVEDVRPDLAGVFPLLLPGDGWANVGQVVDSALATGRPVALIKPMPGLEVKVHLGPSEPSGLTPVLGPAITGLPAHAEDLPIGDALRVAGYDSAPQVFQPGQAVQIDLHWQALRPLPADYTSFVQLLAPDGSKAAQSDHLAGGVYYPTSLWQSGETLLDRHTLQLPADAPPGPYQIYAGMYRLAGADIQPLGAGTLSTPLQIGPER